jgi:hypothetical protein
VSVAARTAVTAALATLLLASAVACGEAEQPIVTFRGVEPRTTVIAGEPTTRDHYVLRWSIGGVERERSWPAVEPITMGDFAREQERIACYDPAEVGAPLPRACP